jgi:hypothetical protein
MMIPFASESQARLCLMLKRSKRAYSSFSRPTFRSGWPTARLQRCDTFLRGTVEEEVLMGGATSRQDEETMSEIGRWRGEICMKEP